MKKRYIIRLSAEEEGALKQLLRKGKQNASVRNRAQVVLLSHRGLVDSMIRRDVGISVQHIQKIRKRCCLYGVHTCVYGAARPGRPKEHNATDEAELAALACSAPPDGHSRWTLSLLRQHMKKRFGMTQVHLLLKKTTASRGGKRCGALDG